MSFNKTAIGIFENEPEANQAIAKLLENGFSNEDISALIPRRSGADITLEKHTKAPEGAVVGASAGAVAAGIAATLVGIGAITIPGLGILLAAGPIVAALAGAAAGAAVGGLGGALIGLGIPEVEAKRYAERVAEGDVLVAVHTETAEALDRARALLDQGGAREVTALREKRSPRSENSQTEVIRRRTIRRDASAREALQREENMREEIRSEEFERQDRRREEVLRESDETPREQHWHDEIWLGQEDVQPEERAREDRARKALPRELEEDDDTLRRQVPVTRTRGGTR